jgi:hypothetical protein
VSAKLAAALLVHGPQGVRRRFRAMQKVVDGVQACWTGVWRLRRIE